MRAAVASLLALMPAVAMAACQVTCTYSCTNSGGSFRSVYSSSMGELADFEQICTSTTGAPAMTTGIYRSTFGTCVYTGIRSGSISRSSECTSPPTTCTDTCNYASDNDCDDGGAGSEFSICTLGTDCNDCGARTLSPPPSSWQSPPPPPSPSPPPPSASPLLSPPSPSPPPPPPSPTPSPPKPPPPQVGSIYRVRAEGFPTTFTNGVGGVLRVADISLHRDGACSSSTRVSPSYISFRDTSTMAGTSASISARANEAATMALRTSDGNFATEGAVYPEPTDGLCAAPSASNAALGRSQPP